MTRAVDLMRLVKRRSQTAGAPPGTLVHVGERRAERTRISVTCYDEEGVDEQEVADPDEITVSESGVTWISVTGLHDVDTIRKLGEKFELHPLVLEDILDAGHRPKVEDLDDYLLCIARAFGLEDGHISSEQISLILRPPLVISFQEATTALFDPVRARMHAGLGRIRTAGADYLLYALLDSVVDSYFAALEQIGDKTERIEQEVVAEPEPDVLREIHRTRSEVSRVRRAIGPMREMLSRLARGDSELIAHEWELFLRDVHDHVIQVAETADSLREVLIGMLDTYLSSASNRMNEVMKVLTIIATIFIPATFVAGVYGMNFDWMPELHFWWAYPATLGLMFLMGAGMVVFFWRKGWL